MVDFAGPAPLLASNILKGGPGTRPHWSDNLMQLDKFKQFCKVIIAHYVHAYKIGLVYKMLIFAVLFSDVKYK